ncbi:MAG: hypothetical protein M3Y42_16260 [Actinomycetota bacterium]|nr:hypothetical protein [Actinomycetota bacterium]
MPPDSAKARNFLAQAADALAQIPRLTSSTVQFNIAYDSAHDVGEAVLAAYGYRTGGGVGAHVAVGSFLAIVFDQPPSSEAAAGYDALRQVRHGLRYRPSTAGASQAAAATQTAATLLDAAQSLGI